MILDKKLLLLILITVFFLFGLILEPYRGSPSINRYIISSLGQFLIILAAVIIGFDRVKSFSFKSVLGKSLSFISLGMLSWGLGALVWLYYNIIVQTEIPYPSLADIGYLGTIPLATYGLFLLLKNIKFESNIKTTLKVIILPIIVFFFVYWLFINSKLAENVEFLPKILNITYPVGDVVFLSFTLIILTLLKGGKLFKPIVIICIGFIIESIADFSFSWTTSAGTYYTGNFVDILFGLAFFTIGLGLYYTKEMK